MLRFLLASILMAATTVTAPQHLDNSDYRLTVDVELVQLPVSVIDKHGLPVRGLRQEQFTVMKTRLSRT